MPYSLSWLDYSYSSSLPCSVVRLLNRRQAPCTPATKFYSAQWLNTVPFVLFPAFLFFRLLFFYCLSCHDQARLDTLLSH
ncbi:hypothetical protein BJX99DRAFT_218310 [Aspergillus californicus]